MLKRVSISVDDDWLRQLAERREITIDNLGRCQGFSRYVARLQRLAEGKP